MVRNIEVAQKLMQYAGTALKSGPNKYLPLIELVKKLSIRKDLESSETKCLIIGGG